MEHTIYLVEDEPNLNQLLAAYLRKEGWLIHTVFTGAEARELIPRQPHLWILDIMLPDIDGYQLLKEIKADQPAIPIIFISARDEDIDRVVGLEMGSDDYIAKPFLPRELVIRVKRLLARVYDSCATPLLPHPLLSIPPYLIDEQSRSVRGGEDRGIIDLTTKEFDLVVFLAKHVGLPQSREQILEQVWGMDYFGSDRVVDDLVRRLRKKMPELKIETMYGYGYRMVKP